MSGFIKNKKNIEDLFLNKKFPLIEWYSIKFKDKSYSEGIVCSEKEFESFLLENKDKLELICQ